LVVLREETVVSGWKSLQDSQRAERALEVALQVSRRLQDPAQVEAAVIESRLQSTESTSVHWTPSGFAQGYAGLALLWGQLDRCFPSEGFDVIGHQHLELAAEGAATQAQLYPGAFGGLAGLAFATHYLSRSGDRYARLLATLEQSLLRSIAPLLRYLNSRNDGVPVNAFDVISGLAGIALYLLTRRKSPAIRRAIDDIVRCFVELSREEAGLPRWHSPAHLSSPEDFMLKQFPNGYLNCGLAHGIPGPLGVMALARIAGMDGPGLEDAVDRLAGWLAAHRLDDRWGVNWPTGLGLLKAGSAAGRIASVNASPRAQAGWCYGAPGIARALYFAGLALDKAEYRDLAIDAIEAVLRRPQEARGLPSPTFCHGVAGLLHIVLRFASDTAKPSLEFGAETLTDQLLGLYEPDSLLGFRALDARGQRIDQPGLLDGAPGVALVLLGAGCEVEPAWDRLFLLSA
jgi:hypothetical protein